MRKTLTLLALSFCFAKILSGASPQLPSVDVEVKTLSPLSASLNKEKDKFSVQVLSPESLLNVIIPPASKENLQTVTMEGEIARSKASGKGNGKAEFSLKFERLVLPDGMTIPIAASVKEIKNSKGVANVDEEGRVIGSSPLKKDILMAALLCGGGAAVGAGLNKNDRGKGAEVGAAIGCGIALTMAFSTKGEDIQLAPGSVFVLNVARARRR